MIKKAMIMAAGVGSRLAPLTQCIPKPLIPIANVPLMDLILKHLENQGIKDVIANTHYLAEKIQRRYVLENPTGVNFNYIFEEELSGTAGGVKKCEFFFEKNESFVVLSADGLCNVDIQKLYASHIESGAIVTMGLYDVSEYDISQFGVVVVDGGGFVKEFQEKPRPQEAKSNLINTGIYIFSPEIFDWIKEDKFQDFAHDVFPYIMHKNIPINTAIIDGYWSDIGSISQYQKSVRDFICGKVKMTMPSYAGKYYGGNIIKPPSFISSNSSLVGNNSIAENCTVKSGAVIKNSILWEDVIVEENAQISGCIVLSGVVKAGEKVNSEIIFQKNVNNLLT